MTSLVSKRQILPWDEDLVWFYYCLEKQDYLGNSPFRMSDIGNILKEQARVVARESQNSCW